MTKFVSLRFRVSLLDPRSDSRVDPQQKKTVKRRSSPWPAKKPFSSVN